MTVTESIQTFFKRYTDFKGRSSRVEYWWPVVMNFVVFMLTLMPGTVMFMIGETPPSFVWVLLALGGLYYLAVLIPTIALNVRRLHDMNQTGWIYLGVVVAGALVNFIQLVATIVIGSIKGTEGPNKYGPDPLNPEEAVASVFE